MSKSNWLRHAVGVGLLALVMRKVFLGQEAMRTVQDCKSQVATSFMVNNTYFAETVRSLPVDQPTLVLILNQYALNMTFNWLCNTAKMKGVHERSLVVTLDDEADRELEMTWPSVKRLKWKVPCLADPFNYGDGKYQLFYLFRANLARAFLSFNKPFWMIQQDTFWRSNLLELEISEPEGESFDILFDRAAETKGSLIAGGYYLARPTSGAKNFFDILSRDLEWWYAPDNTYMTALCSADVAVCGQLPFSTREVPWLVQFDGDTKLGGKLAKMRTLGFYFLKRDGRTCDQNAVATRVVKWSGVSGSLDAAGVRSYSHWQFGLYQAIIDFFYKYRPTEWLLNKVIFPYAHYFMITL